MVDGHSSKFHPINAGVPQVSVLAPTLFLLHINNLLSATTNPIHSYADNRNLDDKRRSMHMSRSEDLQIILDWDTKNLVKFNASKTQSCSLSPKKSTNIHPIFINDACTKRLGQLYLTAFETRLLNNCSE